MNRPRTAVVAVILSGIFYTSTLSADLHGDATSQVAFGIKVAQQGLWREAMYRFERAVRIDPTYAPAWNNLAIACEQEGKMDGAKQAYEKALALSPKDSYIRQNYELFLEIHARAPRASHPVSSWPERGVVSFRTLPVPEIPQSRGQASRHALSLVGFRNNSTGIRVAENSPSRLVPAVARRLFARP